MKISVYFMMINFLIITLFCIGCEKNETEPKPMPMKLQLIASNVTVYNGSDGFIDLTVTGGDKPYQYQWSNGETTEDINNLTAGVYSVFVTDANTETLIDSTIITQPNETAYMTGIDGYIYQTVRIGEQWWMAENLKALQTANGVLINGVYSYNNDENNVAEYGRLYEYDAALNNAPAGWHLPTVDEWNILENSLGEQAGTKLMEGGNSGFNAKLAGYRSRLGDYYDLNNWGSFWTSELFMNDHGYIRNVAADSTGINHWGGSIHAAFSVRYIKD